MIVGWLALSWLSCQGDPPIAPPEEPPGELQVGHARVRMPVPLGIGTVGYGGFGVGNTTPFSEIYPGTERIHNHPDLRVVVVSRGPGHELVFIRSDTIGVFQQLRRELVLELRQRMGRDLDDALILAATHTHSGPGRIVDAGGPFDLIADRFFPEFYDRTIDALADAVQAAYDDLTPGRVGISLAYTDEGHNDRRCEDGMDHENGTLPVIAIEQQGELSALMLAYAVHGTVMGIEDLTLSQDVSGAIEQAVEDRFDHPVQVQMMNAWGADMSPSFPELATQPAAAVPDGYEQMEAVGQVVADAVEAELGSMVWLDEPEVLGHTLRVPINREVLEYDPVTFPFTWGAVYCSGVSDCDPATTVDGLDRACVPFPEDYPAPDQTVFTGGRLGSLELLTFPGEPGTLLAEQIMAEISELGGGDVLFLGYSQDFLGYSILEDDWWQGGYEASGSLWGPRQGPYLADRAVEAWAFAHVLRLPRFPEPDPIEPFGMGGYTPRVPTQPIALGTVLQDVAPTYGPEEEVRLVVAGADPWVGTPLATLQTAAGEPVLRPNGLPWDSDGQAFWVELQTDPSYADDLEASTRSFQWQFALPVRHALAEAGPRLSGSYRLAVAVPDGAGGTVEVVSSAFEVTAP
ncbi:MAG TPA: hypothetical protein ENK18_24400 [Deltaproteobacteria bacterium]|nr:hypothetical protein [Deltaproteobacteria bacterium]